MKYKLTFFLILIICMIQYSYAQDFEKIDPKVDSVFTSYFDFLNPVDKTISDSANVELVSLDIEKQQVIYDFFENISGLYLKREYLKEYEYCKNGISSYCYSTNNGFTKICIVFTSYDYKKWTQWYNENKNRLRWVDDNKKIDKSKGFNYIDYKSFYPSFIRFKERLDWIPISEKPEYVRAMERQMEREGLIDSKKAKVELNKK